MLSSERSSSWVRDRLIRIGQRVGQAAILTLVAGAIVALLIVGELRKEARDPENA